MAGRRRRTQSQQPKKRRPKRQRVFFAYPSSPPSLGETIGRSIEDLHATPEISDAALKIRPWPDISISGTRLLTQITEAIHRSDVVAFDVTYRNANVAFELGYSIAVFKRIWLSLDVSIKNADRDFKHLYTGMLGAGYARYRNHHELMEAFLCDKPWATLDQCLLAAAYQTRSPHSEHPTLLYVKPDFDTDAVISVRERLQHSPFASSLIIDDPRENAGATLEWYADNISDADAVLVHLLGDRHNRSETYNAKASFVAGLAHGFRKPLLMLAHTPFRCPTDYQQFLKEHNTSQDCIYHLDSWMEAIPLPRRRARRSADLRLPTSPTPQLRDLSLGEPVAENERSRLDDYFVETSSFYEAQESDLSIFVGRRGTGKTASFIALNKEFRRDARNHVCTVQPVGYEVDGLIRLLSEDWRTAERGYLIESLWKFLLYTELAASVLTSIEDRPTYQQTTEGEEQLVQYVQANTSVLLASFSQRLNRAVGDLSGTGHLKDIDSQRARISEYLHRTHLAQLRRLLGAALAEKTRVAVLIDNLDDQWRSGSNTRVLSELLFGLLRMTQQIVSDFQHERQNRPSVNLSLTTFIRSDIFSHIEPHASEQDRWPIRRMRWNDPDLLKGIVNERLAHAGKSQFSADEVWTHLFPRTVVGLSPLEFLLSNTLPRPRDVIFLVKETVALAINRRREVVAEKDMLDARDRYSRYVVESVLAEDDPQLQMMEAVLFEFAGSARRLRESEVRERIRQAAVAESDVELYLHLLCDVNFLGIRAATGYAFSEDENHRRLLLEVARKLAAENSADSVVFEVNAAFYQALQID